jgi:hypothetical protein
LYISNLSEFYCSGYLVFSDGGGLLDSVSMYAYSEWTSGANPNQFQYAFPDTGLYGVSLSVTGGDRTDTYTVQISIQDTLSGISQSYNSNNDILVYPNPARGYIVIQTDFGQLNIQDKVLKCAIYNTKGSLLKPYDLDRRLYQQILVLDDLVNGVYLLNFSEKGRSIGNKRLSLVR